MSTAHAEAEQHSTQASKEEPIFLLPVPGASPSIKRISFYDDRCRFEEAHMEVPPIKAPLSEEAMAAVAEPVDARRFECNICLDVVRDPVVTQCGHLYCWPCLYRWLNTGHHQCPVCKAGVTRENVIPLYVRGSDHVDPRTQDNETEIPSRPLAQRPPAPERTNLPAFAGGDPHLGLGNGGIGFFPSLFGLQFQSFAPIEPVIRAGPLSPEEQQQAYLSRLLLMLGSFVILCLLFF